MVLYVDGGCSGNGQTDLSKRRMIAAVTNAVGQIMIDLTTHGGSNNIAELWAVQLALDWCVSNGVSDVTIYTDSRNNLAWVFGKKLGKHLNDRVSVQGLKDKIEASRRRVKLALLWVPRERNLAGHYIEGKYAL